jgi:hypothetical protein
LKTIGLEPEMSGAPIWFRADLMDEAVESSEGRGRVINLRESAANEQPQSWGRRDHLSIDAGDPREGAVTVAPAAE